MLGRVAAGAALLLGAAAIAYVLMTGGSSYELRLTFQNAGQLVNGNLVTVGGLPIGTVRRIELTSDNQAVVTIGIDEERFRPLHEGTKAVVRISSLSSVANRVIALEPGPNNAPALDSGEVVPAAETGSPVEIDQIISTLDMETRTNLQELIHGSSRIYTGAEREANETLKALNPAIGETAGTLAELNRDQEAFRSAIVDSASLMTTVAAQSRDVDGLLRGGASLMSSLATRTDRITSVLNRSPRGLDALTRTFASFDRTFARLRPTVARLRRATPALAGTVRELGPTLELAEPAVRQTRPLVGSLAALLERTPALARTSVPALNATTTSLEAAMPIAEGAQAYFPDLFHGLIGGFGGQVGGYYDANGSYVRIHPIFGGTATGFTNKCPGGAAAAPDGSTPYVPADGTVSCDRGQTK